MTPNDSRIFKIALELRALITVLQKSSREHFEQRLAESNLGVSGLQCGVLHMLSDKDYTSSELSRKFALDPSTLVPVIDTLERKGLIMRGKDPHDRRRTPLSLTPSGQHVLNQLPALWHNDPVLSSLHYVGYAQADALVDLLRQLVQHIPDGEALLQEIMARLQAEYRAQFPEDND